MKRTTAALVVAGAIALSVATAAAEGVQADNAGKEMPAVNYGKEVRADDSAKEVPADNSGKNVRDRSESALTPGDQSSAPGDVAITSAVRMAVVDDPNLSVNAQNVKIITVAGVVTLRGPVATPAEKESVGAKAQRISGVTKVDNQLEVASE